MYAVLLLFFSSFVFLLRPSRREEKKDWNDYRHLAEKSTFDVVIMSFLVVTE